MVWVDGSVLVFVPGGEFIMGAGGDDNPETIVNLSGFWIYRTKVTNRLYALCIAAGECTPPADPEAAEALTDRFLRDRPVVGVNWAQGQAYCEWVQGRLPTEAQWEKTARGPEGNIYPWGDAAPSCDLLNYENCLGKTSRVFDYPVGKSFYEALDMSGNVFEWAFDWYDPLYYPNAPGENPEGPGQGTVRVVRSSSYESTADQVAPYRRFFLEPERTRLDLGFRCVIEDPVAFAPYCQASAYVPDQPDQPSGGCDLSVSVAGRDCGFVTADLQGSTIASVSAENFDCTQVDDTRVYCAGPGGTTDEVTICSACETDETQQTGTPPDYTCEPNYEAATTAPNRCDFQGGGSPDNCPPGFMSDGAGGCSYPEYPGNDCPIGTYATAGSCAGREWPGPRCLSGYDYNADLGCCQAPGQGGEPFQTPELPGYPGCGPDEYQTELGCAPVPLVASASGSGCVTLSLTAGQCSNAEGGCIQDTSYMCVQYGICSDICD
jgi:hypothetical protein